MCLLLLLHLLARARRLLRCPVAARLRGAAKLVEHELPLGAIRRLHDEPPALAVQRHLLVTDLAEQVDRHTRRLAERQPKLVFLDLRLDRRARLHLGAEEAVGRHQASDPLVRPLEVVVAEEVLQGLHRLLEILGQPPLPQLARDRLPEPLALAKLCRPPDYALLPRGGGPERVQAAPGEGWERREVRIIQVLPRAISAPQEH